MSKKLVHTAFIFTFIVISTTTIFSVCFPSVLCGFLDFISVFDMSLFNNQISLFLDVAESTVINTEIVARRVGSGLATAGLGGVGTGIGLVFSGLIKGFSRNPSLKDDLFSYAIFGFALTEAIGLFALMMAFMLLYA